MNDLLFDPEVTHHLQTVWPQSLEEHRSWLRAARAAHDQWPFAIETLAGELVGGCDLRDVDLRSRSAGMGIFLGRPYWDQGYGTDAVRTLCRFGFRELNLQRVDLHVFEPNARGRVAYERVGFKEEGRLRRGHFVDGLYVDVIVMGLLAEELLEP